jgi:hypothetical protein
MTTIVQNFLKVVKRKEPKQYAPAELNILVDEVCALYLYTNDSEDEATLEYVHKKLTDWGNSIAHKTGTRYGPISFMRNRKEEVANILSN